MADYALEGPKWGSATYGTSGGTVTWAVDGTVPATFLSVIQAALADWSSHVNIAFRQVASTAQSQMDFTVGYIDGLYSVAGVSSYTYSGGTLLSDTIKIDSGENWSAVNGTIQSQGGTPLFNVLLHEIGHGIGLDHYNSTVAIMNSVANSSIHDLQASDIHGGQALYGAAPVTVTATATPTPTSTPTVATNASGMTPVYRFFDTASGHHFYTGNATEAAAIKQSLPTFSYEGTPWSTPAKGSDTVDVFRFYDTLSGDHFYTSSVKERDDIIQHIPSYHLEGVAFEAYAQEGGSGTVTLERFYNTVSGLHHYSASTTETATLKSGALGAGWVDEGHGFTVHLQTDTLIL